MRRNQHEMSGKEGRPVWPSDTPVKPTAFRSDGGEQDREDRCAVSGGGGAPPEPPTLDGTGEHRNNFDGIVSPLEHPREDTEAPERPHTNKLWRERQARRAVL